MAIQTVAADSHLRSSSTMGLSAQTPFSIVCWINATWTAGARRSFVGIYGPSTDVALGAPVTALQIGTSTGVGELTCWTWGGGTLVTTAAAAMTPFNGVWVHIGYTFDGTNHRLYRNGILLASSVTAQLPGFLNQVYINGFPTGGTSEVDAFQVDQYLLYRRALVADEVLSIYSAFGSRHGIVKDIITRYEFDAGATTVTSEPDLTDGHTLTFTGAGSAFTYAYVNTLASSNNRPVQ